jgi:hypothetical protein
VTKLAVVRELTDAEKELRWMVVRFNQHATRGRKRTFAGLRELLKDAQAVSEGDIRNPEIRHSPRG